MARKSDKPIYAFVRRGNGLFPEIMNYDVRALDGIAEGQRVRLHLQEWRNLDRLRAYFAMLHDVIEATGANNLSVEKLHQVVKLHTNCVDVVMLPSGQPVAIPSSIAIDAMGEPEFIEFFRKAEEWLSRTYGYVPEARAA